MKNKKEKMKCFVEACKSVKFDPGDDFKIWLVDNGYFTAPASRKYHGAYEGGLFDHSFTVYKRLETLTTNNNLVWTRPQSPFIIGMFHDLCKIDQYVPVYSDEYESDGNGLLKSVKKVKGYEYNPDTILKGHGSKSVMLLSQFVTLTEEEMLCIRYHMGPYEKDDWTEFDKAIHKYQNTYWTFSADMLASKVDGI